MISISTTVVLIAIVLFGAGYWITQKVLKKDKQVDLWQEDLAELSGWLEKICMPKIASIARSASAINVSGAITKLRELRALCQSPAAMVELLAEHFYYQLPIRLDSVEDRAEVVKLVLGHPETRAAVIAALSDDQSSP